MLALLFCVACYLVWREERRMRTEEFRLYQSEKAKQSELIQKLEGQEAQKARRKWLREQLGKLLKEGDQIRWGVLSQKTGAHREHSQWIIKVNEFLSKESEFDLSHRARFDATQLIAISEFIKEFN
jgi:ABC-type nickel/cobalt efflux system permease component RcnA